MAFNPRKGFPMATDDPTRQHSKNLTANDVDSLADRLSARAISRLSADQPEVRTDLLLAAGCCRAFARVIRSSPNGNVTLVYDVR
jgi:hypothetical protein